MIEVWLRFRIGIMLLTIILIGVIVAIINNEIVILIFTIIFSIFYIYVYALTSNTDLNGKEKIPEISHSFMSGKYLTIISYKLMVADGKINDTEKKYFLSFIANEFGYGAQTFRTRYYIKNLDKFHLKGITLREACENISSNIVGKGKIQLLHYYISLVTTDKYLSIGEIAVLRKICKYSRIHYNTLEAVLAMFNYTSEEDLNKKTYVKTYSENSITKYYTILEITESANEEEIKLAYRKLVKIYHPDKQIGKKNANLDFAKQKFHLIQEAYEKVKNYKKIS